MPNAGKEMTGDLTHRFRPLVRGLAPWAVVTLLSLPATLYLWYPGLQTTYDGLYHKARFFELDLLLRSGAVYPRWLPHLNFGYGSPTLHFYAPLIYYVAEAFHLLGFGYLTSYELMIGLGLVAAGWSMFALARRWGTMVGWMAAVFYVYWPYHLELAYVRGAQAELWAMVWFPLLLLYTHKGMEAEGKEGRAAGVGLALLYAALILTHHLSAFAFTPLLLAYLLWHAVGIGTSRRPVSTLGFLALGAGLAAIYWLPVLADISLVWAGRPTGEERAALLRVLVPLRDVLSPYWQHRYYPEQGVGAPSPLPRLPLLFWGLALIVGALRAPTLERPARRAFLFFALVPPALTLLFTRYSHPIWAYVPLIHYLQFPWRLHALIGLGVAMVIGLAVGLVRLPASSSWPIPFLFAALLAFAALPGIHYDIAKEPLSGHPLQEHDVDLRLVAAYDYLRGLFVREFQDIWLFEYMPVWSAQAREDFFLPPAQPPEDAPSLPASITPGPQRPLDRVFHVRSPAPWTLSFHQFYFPAWEVYVDGRRVSTYPRGELGLLAATIPAGEHTLRVRYGHTPAQRVALLLSLLALAIWTGWAARARPGWLAVPALVGLYLLVAAAPAWTPVRGPILPTPQDVTLGEGIHLVGSYIPRQEVQAGERLWFALYWFAAAPPRQRYKVIVHLADREGRTVANGDTEPWFFFTPTTRWQRGELMEDWYAVDVPDDLAPGRYVLLTGMYDAKTVRNLPVQGGTLLGGRILLGEVVVKQQGGTR